MIAEAVSEEAPVAPLFAAMATEIHHVAAQIGQASEARRLDPPLLMGLDEVTQICPVPLPFWLSDSGGKGIQVIALVHGEAQLAGRWGEHGRQVVLDTSSVKVFLPGITDVTTLQAASTLCGQASWKIRGQEHATRHDVATPDMIRQLPAGFALVIRGGCAPSSPACPARGRTPPTAAPATTPPPRRSPPAPGRRPRPPAGPLSRPARARRADPWPRHRLPLELTMTSNDPITALVDELAACGEQLTRLHAREAAHHTANTAPLTGLTAQSGPGEDPGGYQPGRRPPWWKLTPTDDPHPPPRPPPGSGQTTPPGSGPLAATLGPCWPAHDLCLSGLDILAELWSVLRPPPPLAPPTLPPPHA